MTLIEHAKLIINKHTEIEPAYKALLKIVMGDPEMQAECIHPAVLNAIHQARGASTAYTKKHNPSKVNAASVASASAVFAAAFLDSWMVGGKSLGDLTRAELMVEAAKEREQAKARHKCAAFYETLASQVKGDKCVRQVLDHNKARKLWEKKDKPSRGLPMDVSQKRLATA